MTRDDICNNAFETLKQIMQAPSNLSGEDTRSLEASKQFTRDVEQTLLQPTFSLESLNVGEISDARNKQAEFFYSTQTYRNLIKQYPVNITATQIEGVYAEIITPETGILSYNEQRVLINLHGGGFAALSKWGGRLESIPIAALGRIKVITVDYRMAPEHAYPAATEDAVTVYRALLREYSPRNIGLSGCSAGAVLIAQTIAQLIESSLALPGAISMAAAAASRWSGDSWELMRALMEGDGFFDWLDSLALNGDKSYFRGRAFTDPKITPAESDAILSQFPPSLLLGATRDPWLSSVIHTHRNLSRLGVDAELNLWEGQRHGFMNDFNLKASQEVHDIVVKFFHRNLGGS
jgi:epsilon-lactone hydrolase